MALLWRGSRAKSRAKRCMQAAFITSSIFLVSYTIYHAQVGSVGFTRLGFVRPLYYTVVGNRLLFASEMKALFAVPGVSRELDPKGLDNVFTFWTTLPPRTIFKNIQELPPGHSLTRRNGEITVRRHWTPRFPDASQAVTEPPG